MSINNGVHELISGTNITLSQKQYLASGGEADLYKKGNAVYKIYQTARSDEFKKKLEWLHAHPLANVGNIQDILTDRHNNVIGLVMPFIDGVTLGQTFPSSWQQRNQWSEKNTLNVVQQMSSIVESIHNQQCLIVDCNEGNWLLKKETPFVIDIDSWAIPGHKPNAIMPSIQDPLSGSKFNKGTDWFSWAVITFMLWTGMHPYKGTHPKYPKNSLALRMTDGISVLDHQVNTPNAMRDATVIPVSLLEWYDEVFKHKTREAPPQQWNTKKRIAVKKVTSAVWGGLSITDKGPLPAGIVTKWTPEYIEFKDGTVMDWSSPGVAHPAAAEANSVWYRPDHLPSGQWLNANKLLTPNSQPQLWFADNRLFLRENEDTQGLHELAYIPTTPPSLAITQRWPVLTQASQWYDNTIVQTIMSSVFVTIVQEQGVSTIRIPMLDKLRIHNCSAADFDNIWVIAEDIKTRQTMLYYFNAQAQLLYEEEINTTALQRVTLKNGVSVIATPNTWFISKKAMRKQWSNVNTPEDLILGTDGHRILAAHQQRWLHISMV